MLEAHFFFSIIMSRSPVHAIDQQIVKVESKDQVSFKSLGDRHSVWFNDLPTDKKLALRLAKLAIFMRHALSCDTLLTVRTFS